MQLAESDYTSTFQAEETRVVLNNTAIESPDFSGEEKRIAWSEISGADVEKKGKKVWLVLSLGGASVNRHGFFSLKAEVTRLFASATRNRVMLDLTGFDEPVREKMLNAINVHVLRVQEESVDEDLLAAIFDKSGIADLLKGASRRSWMTYGLIIANMVSFLLMLLSGSDFSGSPSGSVFKFLGIAAASEHPGDWWKIVLSPFFHKSIACFIIDLAVLCYLGPVLERIYGQGLFILIYLGSAVIGNAASDQFAASSGASGAIFGLCGAITAHVLLQKSSLSLRLRGSAIHIAWGFIFVSLMLGLCESGFDLVGHAASLLGGFLITLVLPERPDRHASRRIWMMRMLAAIMLVFLLAGGMTMLVRPVTEPIAAASLLLRSAERYKELTKALQQQRLDIKEQTLSCDDADEQNRSVYVPAFRKLSDDISKLELPPGDPKERFRSHLGRMSSLMEELLSMKTEYTEGDRRQGTVDEAKAERIKREISDLSRYFNKGLDALKKQ